MIDKSRRLEKERAKAKQRKRIHVEIDPDNYDYIPEAKQTSYYDNDVPQRVAIYVRVSTDDVRQTTSFELQKRYYEDFVVKHPHWTLVNIYADDTAIMGLNQNPVQTGVDLVPFFFLSHYFQQMRVYLLNDRKAVSGQHPHAGRRFCIWRYIRWQRQRQELPPKKLSVFHLTSFI